MALTRTTLTAAITPNQLTFGVANTAVGGFPAVGAAPLTYQPLVIDDEVMFLVSVPAANIITVRGRGSDGTLAIAHDVGSSVVTSATPIDFPMVAPGVNTLLSPWAPDARTFGQDGALTTPVEGLSVWYLAKSTAGAYTLGAPSLAQNGIDLIITSQTAAAHTVTVPGSTGTTGLFYTGGAGGPFTVATFGAQIGATMKLVAQNGAWTVASSSITAVTFS